MKLKLKESSTIELKEGTVDITDPCYDDNVWCRINSLKIKSGTWKIENWVADGRTFALVLYNLDYWNRLEHLPLAKIGNVGVDAGMCGVFENKPNYNETEWLELCDVVHDEKLTTNAPEFKCKGVCCCSGYGDGYYPVLGKTYDTDEYVYLEIKF